jgi:hypothetical protein
MQHLYRKCFGFALEDSRDEDSEECRSENPQGDRGHEYKCQLCCDAGTSTTIDFQARVAKIRTSEANGGVVDQARTKVYAIVHRALLIPNDQRESVLCHRDMSKDMRPPPKSRSRLDSSRFHKGRKRY